ncbi:MAG: 2,3-bisphosphoglycerate-dependent phosphoglycerate mutase [Chlamydiales bacterium]
MSPKLILLRHGESVWNQENLFTGWVDIPMNQKGIEEAISAGEAIKKIPIDAVFTSSLIRAQMTVPLALLNHSSGKIPVFLHPGEGHLDTWAEVYSEETKKRLIPVFRAWELNERMYGRLQGLNKAETARQFGAEQVQIWRRSFDGKPPEGESLSMTAARTLPYFKKRIAPHLEKGETVLISAHGNSLRSIVMYIENLTPDEIVKFEFPTGTPRIYSYCHGRYDLS